MAPQKASGNGGKKEVTKPSQPPQGNPGQSGNKPAEKKSPPKQGELNFGTEPVRLGPDLQKFFKKNYLKDQSLALKSKDGVSFEIHVTFTPLAKNGMSWDKAQTMEWSAYLTWLQRRSQEVRGQDQDAAWKAFLDKVKLRLGLEGIPTPQITGPRAQQVVLHHLSPKERQILNLTQKVYAQCSADRIKKYLIDDRSSWGERSKLLTKCLVGGAIPGPVMWPGGPLGGALGAAELRRQMILPSDGTTSFTAEVREEDPDSKVL